MKRVIRFVGIALATIIAATLLVACASKDSADNDSEATNGVRLGVYVITADNARGWYVVLVGEDAWNDAPQEERDQAIAEAQASIVMEITSAKIKFQLRGDGQYSYIAAYEDDNNGTLSIIDDEDNHWADATELEYKGNTISMDTTIAKPDGDLVDYTIEFALES